MLEFIQQHYPWFDHPEGMKFAEVHRDPHQTIGHWLFLPGAISAFHRLTHCEEIWAIHLGRLDLHLIAPDGTYRLIQLGLDLATGERPLTTVPKDHWQAAELPTGVPFAFGTNVCAPPFEYSKLELATCGRLMAAHPQHRTLVERLTLRSQARAPHSS